MYRIQLASGYEAVYRSLEELAVSVQNGIICPDALVYHRKTGSWLPIEAHPHYHVARELVLPERLRPARERPERSPNPEPPLAAGNSGPKIGPVTRPGSPRVEHPRPARGAPGGLPDDIPGRRRGPDISPSFVESLRKSDPDRPIVVTRRPGRMRGSWVLAAAVSGLVTIGWMYFSPDSGRPSSPGMLVAGMESPVMAPTDSPVQPSVEGASPPGALPVDRADLTYDDAYREARSGFDESMASLGFEHLFAPSRIATADGLRTARRLLAAARNVLAVYRGEEVRIDQAFGMADASKREPYGTARSVDSLFASIDSIYALLQAAKGRYQLRKGRIAFDDPLFTSRYVGQAIWLQARLRDWNRNPVRTPMTIRPIVAAVGRVPRSQTGF